MHLNVVITNAMEILTLATGPRCVMSHMNNSPIWHTKKYQKFFFFLILMVVQTLHPWLYFVNLYYMSSHEKNLRSFNGINKKRQFEWNMYKSNGEVVHVWHHTSWARCQCEDPHSSSDHNIQMLITFLLFIHFFSNFHWSASLIFLFLYNLMNS